MLQLDRPENNQRDMDDEREDEERGPRLLGTPDAAEKGPGVRPNCYKVENW